MFAEQAKKRQGWRDTLDKKDHLQAGRPEGDEDSPGLPELKPAPQARDEAAKATGASGRMITRAVRS